MDATISESGGEMNDDQNNPANYPRSLLEAIQQDCSPGLVSFYGHTMEYFDMPMHRHPQLEIMYVVTGSCRIPLADSEIMLREGDFIFVDSGTPHRLVIEPAHPCRIYMLEILCLPTGDEPRLGSLAAGCPQLLQLARQGRPWINLHDSGDLFQTISQLQLERENNPGRQDHALKLAALFTCFFIELSRCVEQANQRSGYRHVRQAMQYIQQNYDSQLAVGDAARIAGLHPAHLQRLFQQHRHQSVYDYINQLRLEKACMLLLNSSLPVIDIAVSAGFNSRQNFGLAFRHKFGLPPGEYRRRRGNLAISPGERAILPDDFYLELSSDEASPD